VVDRACDPTLHASLALTALCQALHERRPAPGVLHHSDHGVQYARGEYRQALQAMLSHQMESKVAQVIHE
jgi:transposase InsO family protein